MNTIAIKNAGLALAAALATSAATLGAFPLSAHAAPAIVVTAEPTVRVSHADLNLASPAGVAKLDGRVRQAAERLCEVPAGKSPLKEAQEAKACVDETIAAAQPQVRRAILLQAAPQLAAASR